MTIFFTNDPPCRTDTVIFHSQCLAILKYLFAVKQDSNYLLRFPSIVYGRSILFDADAVIALFILCKLDIQSIHFPCSLFYVMILYI